MTARVCELCNGEVALYCASDSAFLCWSCDARVHEANFLVARHVRRPLCSQCNGYAGKCIAGVGFRPLRTICTSCSTEYPGCSDRDSSSSSSVCVSSTESYATAPKKAPFDRLKMEKMASSSSVTKASCENSNFPVIFSGEVTSTATRSKKKSKARTRTPRSQAPSNVDEKLEGVLVNWCRKMGLNSNCTMTLASHALGPCLGRSTVLPSPVSLAASLWFSLRACVGRSASTWQNLKRLEDVSGQPAKLILAAELKLARALKSKKPPQRDQEEGWAEC